MPFFASLFAFCFFLGAASVQAQPSAATKASGSTEKSNTPPKHVEPASKAKVLDPFADAQKVLDQAQSFHQQEEMLSRKRLQQEGYQAPPPAAPAALSPQSAPANSTR